MKLAATLALALPLLTALPATADVVTIDFETAPSFASIDGFYAGQGITFGLDVLGVQNDALGPYFSNAPSPVGVMTAVGGDSTMNVGSGFIAMSFFYSSNADIADAVEVYSGLNGTGTLLASLSLTNNAQAGCTDSPFCRFDLLGASFSERAFSVKFGNAAFAAAFDDVALTVPEPATTLMVGLGLMGVALSRRRS